ncbi:MAG: glycosyltransferase family 4 protein [Candidatus Muiribacteriota bacterium]
MKILFVSSSGNFFGGEKIIFSLAKEFKKFNYDIHVLIPFKGKFSQELEKENINYEILNIRNSFDFKCIPTFIKIIKKIKPDLIHSHGFSPNLFSRFVSFITKVPVICTIHVFQNHSFKNFGIKGLWYQYIEKFSYILSKKRCINTVVGKYLIKDIEYLNPVVIYNGLEKSDMQYLPPEKIKTFGMAGRIVWLKGLEEAVEAFSICLIEYPNIKFVIAGEDITPEKKWEKSLKEKIKKLGIEDKVEFMGFVDNIEDFYQKIDCLLLPSKKEPFGLVVIEALLRNKIVVASNTTEILSKNYFEEFLINSKNILDFADKLKKLLKINSNEINRIFYDIKTKKLLENFSKENMINNYFLVYKNLLKKNQ